MSKLVLVDDKRAKNARWPLDCALERIDDFDEILVIAKKKGQSAFTKFSSGFRDSYWWIGALESVQLMTWHDGVTSVDE